MNKIELINGVAIEAGISKAQAKAAVKFKPSAELAEKVKQ